MLAIIGTQTSIILKLPHANNPLCDSGPVMEARTFLNLNSRNDNGIAHIVKTSIIDRIIKAAPVSP